MDCSFIPEVLSQHAEEASFLWLTRGRAIHAPHYSLKDLTDLDNRLDAHIDGLRIAGADAWPFIDENLALEEAGEVFTAAVMAFDASINERVRNAVTMGCRTPGNFSALVSALGWHPYSRVEIWIDRFLSSPRQKLRHLAIAACAIHRHDPGTALDKAVVDDYLPLRARALRAVGELKRRDLSTVLLANLDSNDEACRFWAAWSATLLRERNALAVLQAFAETKSGFQHRAFQLLLRTMSLDQARNWLNSLSDRPAFTRLLVQGAGMLGDPAVIPWLLEQMKIPAIARVAGEAFSSITGVDISYQDLEGEQPEGFEAGPNDNPGDDSVDLDQDENLPWPAPDLVDGLWTAHGQHYHAGTRYLIGQPITEKSARQALLFGTQRQRNAAALELALLLPDEHLFEVRGPGFRQKALLPEVEQ